MDKRKTLDQISKVIDVLEGLIHDAKIARDNPDAAAVVGALELPLEHTRDLVEILRNGARADLLRQKYTKPRPSR